MVINATVEAEKISEQSKQHYTQKVSDEIPGCSWELLGETLQYEWHDWEEVFNLGKITTC